MYHSKGFDMKIPKMSKTPPEGETTLQAHFGTLYINNASLSGSFSRFVDIINLRL